MTTPNPARRPRTPDREDAAERDAASARATDDQEPSRSTGRNANHDRTRIDDNADVADEIRDETDLADIEDQREADRRAAEPRPHADAAETAIDDIRQTAAREPRREGEDEVRVPTAAETTDSVRRAQRALAEIRNREGAERRRDADQARRDQITRWHQHDRDVHARAAEREDAHGYDR